MKRLTLLVLVLAACGDNHSQPDARERGDAPPPDAHVPVPRAVAVAGDFGAPPGTGVISSLDIAPLAMRTNIVQGVVQGDPALRQYGDKLYVINRFGSNNITILEASTLQFVDQISTGTDSNPQDVAVVGNKLYIPAMGTAGVVVLALGSSALKTIDLSALDTIGTNDGKPDCVSAYAVGTKVYVACGVLDSFNDVEVGKVAVIDSTTDTMIGSAPMSYGNPYGFFVRAPEDSTYAGDLLIGTFPDFTNYATGCVERVSTGTTTTVACGVTNQELGGYVNRLAVAADGSLLYAAVGTYDASFNETGTLKGFDLETGMLWTAPLSATSELITDVAACPGGDVVATDKTLNAGGLRVWRGTTERTSASLSIGMAPRSVNALACYDAAQ